MFIASLILGIASIVLSWVPILGFLIAVTALIISIVAMVKRKKNKEAKNSGMAIPGLITSIIGLIFSMVMSVFIIVALIISMSNKTSKNITGDISTQLNNSLYSQYDYETMTGTEVRTAIRSLYSKDDFILEAQSEKDGVYLQYGEAKGSGGGISKYKSTRKASSQSGYTRNTTSSLSSNILSSSSYTSTLIKDSLGNVIGISFTRNK